MRALVALGKIIRSCFFFFWIADYFVACSTQLTCFSTILENGTVASWKRDDWWYVTFWIRYFKSAVIQYFSKMSLIGSRRILNIWQIFKYSNLKFRLLIVLLVQLSLTFLNVKSHSLKTKAVLDFSDHEKPKPLHYSFNAILCAPIKFIFEIEQYIRWRPSETFQLFGWGPDLKRDWENIRDGEHKKHNFSAIPTKTSGVFLNMNKNCPV